MFLALHLGSVLGLYRRISPFRTSVGEQGVGDALRKKMAVLQMNPSKHLTQSSSNTSLRHLMPGSIEKLHFI